MTLTVSKVTAVGPRSYEVQGQIGQDHFVVTFVVEGDAPIRSLAIAGESEALSAASDQLARFHRDFWKIADGEDLPFPLVYE